MTDSAKQDFSKKDLTIVTVEPVKPALKQGYGVTKLEPK